MQPDHWQRLKSLFDSALDLPVAERTAFLELECGEDLSLRRELARLLAKDSQAESGTQILDAGVSSRLLAPHLGETLVGKRIGAYQIRAVLGAGGMGTVYEAIQDHPQRKVALKVMSRGLFSPQARRRFQYESEVLARLRHPGIAQIYEAGTWQPAADSPEVPFFAMEYVEDAKPLDDWAEGMDRDRVLELFGAVCQAVHHGHQRGFIHRDLKPHNILVAADGQPKIIDFGIARATETQAGSEALHTQEGQVLGTMQYMAPEQLGTGPEDPDIRVDVYALGVILFEVLTGKSAFDLAGKPLHIAAGEIIEQGVSRPSTLQDDLAPELDWIVLKATARDRDRRYASAAELAADIQRLHRHEPVLAGPPSAIYRVRKFVRRHRLAMATSAIALVALVTGTVLATVGMFRARAAEQQATEQLRTQRAVTSFLTEMLRSPDPARSGRKVLVVDLLEQAVKNLDPLVESQPWLAMTLENTLGLTYRGLGMLPEAEQLLRRATDNARQHLGEEHGRTLTFENNLASVIEKQNRLQEALVLYEKVVQGRTVLLGADNHKTAEAHHNLAIVLHRLTRYGEAEQHFLLARQVFHPEEEAAIANSSALAMTLWELERHAEAERLGREAADTAIHTLGEDHPRTLFALGNLASILSNAGKQDEAVKTLKQCLAIRIRIYGEDNVHTLTSMANLSVTLSRCNREEEAERYLRRCMALSPGRRPLANQLIDRNSLGVIVSKQGRHDEARKIFERLFVEARTQLPKSHWLNGAFHKSYGDCLLRAGDYAGAEVELQQAVKILTQKFGPKHHRTQSALQATAELYRKWGKTNRARAIEARLVKRR